MDILITFALIATSLSDQVPWDCSFCEDGRRGRTLAAAAGVVDCGVGRRLCGAHETHARAHARVHPHAAADTKLPMSRRCSFCPCCYDRWSCRWILSPSGCSLLLWLGLSSARKVGLAAEVHLIPDGGGCLCRCRFLARAHGWWIDVARGPVS